jgi:hypothetical protein
MIHFLRRPQNQPRLNAAFSLDLAWGISGPWLLTLCVVGGRAAQVRADSSFTAFSQTSCAKLRHVLFIPGLSLAVREVVATLQKLCAESVMMTVRLIT